MDLIWTEEEGCGQIMASFYTDIKCAHCHDKGSRNDHCVLGSEDCLACMLLTPDQHQQLFERWRCIRVFLLFSGF